MASPPAEKATASKDPTGKSGTGDGTGHCGYGTDLKLGDRKVKATVQYGVSPIRRRSRQHGSYRVRSSRVHFLDNARSHLWGLVHLRQRFVR